MSDYVYVWADGIHLRIRLAEAKSCVLVVMGVRADGTKELIAMADGYRESAESWADLLRDAARRGMHAPVLAVGDGALGFWKALAEVFPDARHQRCWVHKMANVLNALPKSAQPGARKALQDIYNAEDREHAVTATAAFAKMYGTKWPKAVKKITDDVGELLAFFDFPDAHAPAAPPTRRPALPSHATPPHPRPQRPASTVAAMARPSPALPRGQPQRQPRTASS